MIRVAIDPLPPASYRHWRIVVDLTLRDYTGRALADVPVDDHDLRIWYNAGSPARIVGNALQVRAPKVRYTLSRFYTDQRPREEVKRLRARFEQKRAS